MSDAAPGSFFDRIGGLAGCRRLVDAFYTRVAADERLRDLFPRDMAEPTERLARFVAELVGGPELYSFARGRPRMRRRHQRFAIGPGERDAWLENMRAALDDVAIGATERDELWRVFEEAADALVNDPTGGRRRRGTEIDRSNPISGRHG
jgi:hemoglobin